MVGREVRRLTEVDKTEIFRLATRGFALRYSDPITSGMTDEALEAALSAAFGIFGGSGGPDTYSISFTGSGLRIWGGWHVVNHVTEKPLFAGKATIAKAREVYGIGDPSDDQLCLF